MRQHDLTLAVAALLLTLLPCHFATAQQAIEQGGNILFVDGKSNRLLTGTGRDHDPFLSASCRSVVFIRDVNVTDGTKRPSVQTEIWTVVLEPGTPPALAYRGPFRLEGVSFTEFWRPKFSPDCRSIYFMFDYSSVVHGLARIDRQTDRAEFVAAGMDYTVIQSGNYVGDILVQERMHSDLGYDYVWAVISPSGEPIKPIGGTEAALAAFLKEQGIEDWRQQQRRP